ncbi:respiratory nitrate reductase subunit gamma [Tomitella gaofuii]|uniref:respiratory nitrate reductase subunit gamma n=1 Tax=Tomitella gaofuii TaxID=2760083 RepID=UPI0015F999B8|nr:respiratory nitrate reductase subunit gamma [Tomitella gaofuii]
MSSSNGALEVFWDVIPYVSLAMMIVGLVWRYRYDKFGWTTRSSQLYESRLLRIGSPLFHYGIIVVFLGHIIGLVIPQSWTDAIGISETAYRWVALGAGGIAGLATLVGVSILIYRRRRTGPVFIATTWNDKWMYVLLVATLVAGLSTTVIGMTPSGRAPDANYRETVSPWFRDFWSLQPDGSLMAAAPVQFQVHVAIALVLFAIWPLTRLVHVFSAPVWYLFRPYIVYRSRSAAQDDHLLGSDPQRRGWSRDAPARW